MTEEQEPSAQFLELLDIAERQKRIIEQRRQAETQGSTDNQLWEAELASIAVSLHGSLLRGATPDQVREFNEALLTKSKGKNERD
jgi:hypothetical protein